MDKFYRIPKFKRNVWLMNLFDAPDPKIDLNNIYVAGVCQQHFKPEDLQVKMRDGKPYNTTLKPGALPQSIYTYKPINEV